MKRRTFIKGAAAATVLGAADNVFAEDGGKKPNILLIFSDQQHWQALGTVWAEVKSATGRETAAGEATLSRASYRITLRAAPFGSPSRPLPDQRFRDGPRLFTIEAVTEADPNGRYLVCVAQEERVA